MTEITQTDLDDELTVVYLLGCKDGAEKERAAIVDWLMREEEEHPFSDYSGFAAMIRKEIKAGVHLK